MRYPRESRTGTGYPDAVGRWLVVFVAACGRIGFDATLDGDARVGGDGDADGGGGAGMCNRVDRLSDDFSDGTRSVAHWRRAYMDPGTATSEQGGDLVITLAQNTPMVYAGYITSHAYDLRGRRVVMEVAQQPVSPAEMGMAVAVNNENHLSIGLRGNTMYMGAKLSGTFVEYAQRSYDLATQRYVALSERDGHVSWETSSDGIAYTAWHDRIGPLDVSSLFVHVYAGTFDAQANPGSARIAAINPGATAGPGCPISELTDDLEDGASWPHWDDSADACCSVLETGGGLLFTTDGTTGSAIRASRAGYNLVGGEVTVRLVAGPSTSSQLSARLFAFMSSTNEVDLRVDASTVTARTIINGTPNNVSVARTGNENYLRIRETLGTVHFETSTDRMTWTSVHTLPTPFPFDDLEIRLQGMSTTAGISDMFTFDDVNR